MQNKKIYFALAVMCFSTAAKADMLTALSPFSNKKPAASAPVAKPAPSVVKPAAPAPMVVKPAVSLFRPAMAVAAVKPVAPVTAPAAAPTVMPTTVTAIPVSKADYAISIGRFIRLQDENAQLKAKLASLKITSSASGKPRSASVAAHVTVSSLPSVRSVYGVDNDLVATVAYSNGRTLEVHRGDTVSGGYRVLQISANRVAVRKGRKVFPLSFSEAAQSNAIAVQPMSLPGASPIPPFSGPVTAPSAH